MHLSECIHTIYIHNTLSVVKEKYRVPCKNILWEDQTSFLNSHYHCLKSSYFDIVPNENEVISQEENRILRV